MKKILSVFLFCLIFSNLSSQEVRYDNLRIDGMGYISIPENLELQSGLYKKLAEAIQLHTGTITYEILGDRIVFQQVGVNEGAGKNTYARIIIKTRKGKKGDFATIHTKNQLSSRDIIEYNSSFKKEMEKEPSITLVNMYGFENVFLNSKFAGIRCCYVRKFTNREPVYVELYNISNNDRGHELTFSYRVSDRMTWEPIFKSVLESLIILESK